MPDSIPGPLSHHKSAALQPPHLRHDCGRFDYSRTFGLQNMLSSDPDPHQHKKGDPDPPNWTQVWNHCAVFLGCMVSFKEIVEFLLNRKLLKKDSWRTPCQRHYTVSGQFRIRPTFIETSGLLVNPMSYRTENMGSALTYSCNRRLQGNE